MQENFHNSGGADSSPSRTYREPGNGETQMPLIVYILYLVYLFTGGLSGVVGLIIAYVYNGNGPQWLNEHYRYQIRTFWIFLLYLVVSAVLMWVLIGFVLMAASIIWYILRCIKGIQALQQRTAPPNVDSWFL